MHDVGHPFVGEGEWCARCGHHADVHPGPMAIRGDQPTSNLTHLVVAHLPNPEWPRIVATLDGVEYRLDGPVFTFITGTGVSVRMQLKPSRAVTVSLNGITVVEELVDSFEARDPGLRQIVEQGFRALNGIAQEVEDRLDWAADQREGKDGAHDRRVVTISPRDPRTHVAEPVWEVLPARTMHAIVDGVRYELRGHSLSFTTPAGAQIRVDLDPSSRTVAITVDGTAVAAGLERTESIEPERLRSVAEQAFGVLNGFAEVAQDGLRERADAEEEARRRALEKL